MATQDENTRNYGLHKKQIEIQQPDINKDLDDSGIAVEKHYLGERYLEDFSEPVRNDENSEEVYRKQMVAVSKEDGSIFDKSKQIPLSYYDNPEDQNNIKSNKIDENEYFLSSENNRKSYEDFNPSNKTSGLYTGVFENKSNTERNTDGANIQSLVDVKNDKLPSDKIVSRKNSVLRRNIEESRGSLNPNDGSQIELDDIFNEKNIGYTPWDGTNDFNAITTNVDMQDEQLLDDLEDASDLSSSGFDAAKGSLKNLISNNIGIINGAKSLKNNFNKKEKYLEYTSNRPGAPDDAFTKLSKAKSEKYKNIKMSSKIGTYNSLYNLIGTASGMFVGSLGKSMISNIVDDMTSKFTGGFGLAGMIERLSGVTETMPSLEEIVSLNLINYYNMYTAKPGRIVTDRYHKYNFITPNIDDNLDGNRNKDSNKSLFEYIQKGTELLNSGINYASSWFDGTKISGLVGKLGKKKVSIYDGFFDGSSDNGKDDKGNVKNSFIISLKRTEQEKEIVIYDNGVEKIQDYIEQAQDAIKERIKLENIRGKTVNNLLGGLYVEPYFNSLAAKLDSEGASENGGLECYTIPFQFNPVINDGGYEAKYQVEDLMGRLVQVRSYTGTNPNTITLETKYLATNSEQNKERNNSGEHWMEEWTPDALFEIENKYKKLVLPFIYSKHGVFVRPPIVRINFGYNQGDNNKDHVDNSSSKEATISTLFNYGNIDDCIEITNKIDKFTSEKRYIVTNLQINPINADGFDYYINYNVKNNKNDETKSFRRGFSVSLTLAETTKNFLDSVPNYYNYSKSISKTVSMEQSNYKNGILNNEDIPDASGINNIKNFAPQSNEEVNKKVLDTINGEAVDYSVVKGGEQEIVNCTDSNESLVKNVFENEKISTGINNISSKLKSGLESVKSSASSFSKSFKVGLKW